MSIEPTYHGYIESTQDTLLIFEACRRGILPRICRRLQEKERLSVKSGSVFVFDERESGIKRWTDGRVWSPSRILGNFLVYRELSKRSPNGKKESSPSERHRGHSSDVESQAEKNRMRDLVGSLQTSYNFKPGGLIKKTMSIVVNGVSQHMISYYTTEDVQKQLLLKPSSVPNLACLDISQDFLSRQNFRIPPLIEGFADIGEQPPSPISAHSSSISPTSSPTISMNNACRTHDSGSPPLPHRMNNRHNLEYVIPTHRIKLETENGDEIYRPPSTYTSSYNYSPSSLSNNASDSNTLPNIRGFLPSHRQHPYNEFPPITTPHATRLITTSPPPMVPGHHLSTPTSEYGPYYQQTHGSGSNGTPWNDYQMSYPPPSQTTGIEQQHCHPVSPSHEPNQDVFYTTSQTHTTSNETLPALYPANCNQNNSYNDMPPNTLPELYNSSHPPHSSSSPSSNSQHRDSPSPVLPASPATVHRHRQNSATNGPITPPAITNNTATIINAGCGVGTNLFSSPLNYPSQYTSQFVKNEGCSNNSPLYNDTYLVRQNLCDWN